jgi:hypothetical protein
MTDRSRVAITLATALLLGASAYGHSFAISLPGALQGIWNASGGVVYLLAIVGVFAVYRWWALLPAIAPLAVTVYLYNLTDYVSPWRDESVGTLESPVVYILLLIVGLGVQAVVLSVGLLLRAAWEWVRSRNRKSALPGPA